MGVRMSAYGSALAGEIVAYVEYKASLGVEGETRNYVLLDLDRHLGSRGATELTREDVLSWVDGRLERTGSKYTSWMSIVRDFGRYLRSHGHGDAYVLASSYASKSWRPTPFLPTEEEVERFFLAIPGAGLRGPMSWQSTAMFGLMCSCGLRPCEVRRLRRRDVLAGTPAIDVVESKGHRSRRLAVTGEVVDMLAESDARTTAAVGADRPFLFATGRGGQVSQKSLSGAFRRIWTHAGLPAERGGSKATCYLFRHRFAYANIERWGASGADVDAMMPYLSSYMGHSSIRRTMYYAHTSPDFLSAFSETAKALDSLLPEVGFDG